MTTKAKNTQNDQQRSIMIIGAIIGVAVLAAVLVIILNASSSASLQSDVYSDIPQRRGDDGAFILGDPEAPITIIEFADFACPACQQYKPDVNRLVEEYVATGQAQLEWRTFATAGGETTRYAAKLVECSEELQPGSFWAAHEVMYDLAVSGNYTQELARPFAERMGLDVGALVTCSRDANQGVIDERYARSLGVDSTPTVLYKLGEERPQPVPNRRFDALAQLIESVQ